MARKNLLKGLMEEPKKSSDGAAEAPARVDAAKPRYKTGAIGAVSKSIEDLKRRAVVDLDPRMIDGAGLKDRLGEDAAAQDALVASIREYGQQVPVLVRPNPNDAERFEVVYGRRRVAALKSLGLPVKALVRVLDDRALVMAQGQENTARRDLSFIEKCNFARQMVDAGYDRKAIIDALSIDKTLVSRMLSVTERIPVTLIEAIGAAPSFGRDRWLALAALVEKSGLSEAKLVALAHAPDSDGRFDAVVAGLKTPKAAPPPKKKTALVSNDGAQLGEAVRARGKLTLTLKTDETQGFEDWLLQALPDLHRDWKSRQDG